jgi:hypothetical protein
MSNEKTPRTVLPIPARAHVGLTTYDAKDPDTKYPPIEQLRPPKGAPNILVILLDDVGFGTASAFGGPCRTPNLEKLASAGLKYTRFHTTALCSPTRHALLTGRNHHSVGMGGSSRTMGAALRKAVRRLSTSKAKSAVTAVWKRRSQRSSPPTKPAMSALGQALR